MEKSSLWECVCVLTCVCVCPSDLWHQTNYPWLPAAAFNDFHLYKDPPPFSSSSFSSSFLLLLSSSPSFLLSFPLLHYLPHLLPLSPSSSPSFSFLPTLVCFPHLLFYPDHRLLPFPPPLSSPSDFSSHSFFPPLFLSSSCFVDSEPITFRYQSPCFHCVCLYFKALR